MGMKMMSAKGSRFDKISLGRPCVSMVAACEVRLLFNWLKQSPAHTHTRKSSWPVHTRDKERDPRTEDREPRKDAASLETTPDLVYPIVVKLHPLGFLADHLGGLGALPEIISGKLSEASDGVPAETTAKSVSPKTHRSAQHGAIGRGKAVSSITQPEDDGREKEDDRRECECEPETHILRGHTMLRNGHQQRGKFLPFPHRPW